MNKRAYVQCAVEGCFYEFSDDFEPTFCQVCCPNGYAFCKPHRKTHDHTQRFCQHCQSPVGNPLLLCQAPNCNSPYACGKCSFLCNNHMSRNTRCSLCYKRVWKIAFEPLKKVALCGKCCDKCYASVKTGIECILLRMKRASGGSKVYKNLIRVILNCLRF